jgi:hypothetical protein
MNEISHLSLAELEKGLDTIRQSPKNEGSLVLIVRRPAVDQREVLEDGELNQVEGLVGDSWRKRARIQVDSGLPNPDSQLTLINARLIALVAQAKERWQLAGDQLVVDLDLSLENLPSGTRLGIGSAIIEVTAKPHTGCDKFAGRFGPEALKWVNSPLGKSLRLRGINAKVVQGGIIHVGDLVRKA